MWNKMEALAWIEANTNVTIEPIGIDAILSEEDIIIGTLDLVYPGGYSRFVFDRIG